MYRPPHVERNWIFLEPVPVPQQLFSLGNYPEIVYQTLVRRGFNDLEKARRFIDFSKYQPCSPYELPDMDRGISRIMHAIDSGQKIGVWGDFDVDGQTSTAILVSALRDVGAEHLYHIPVRGPETHGIGLKPLKEFIGSGVEVILTCDTGISAFESVSYAQSRGIDVIVTDHHLLPESLPPAHAIINPHRLPGDHPLSTLPGAGTALKFAEALLTAKGLAENTYKLHDLAALGCVADLADLTGETRYLVQSGLNRLRTTPRPAIAALLQSANVDSKQISEEHISFTLAPRLNAVGRLSDANPLVSFLLSEDPVEIAVTVNQVEGLNSQRKYQCDQVFQGALAQLEQDRTLLEQPILILQHQDWPAGVVGIVASRLVEIFHRPVILLVAAADATLRGSARSVEGIDITAALTLNHDSLLSFGGHAMAAGLSLTADSYDAFKRGMSRTISEMSTATSGGADLVIDARMPPGSITLEHARATDVLSPFGPANPSLLFAAQGLSIVNATAVGKLGEHLLVDLESTEGEQTRFIRWNGTDLPMPEGRFDLAYTAHASNYRGKEQVQFEWIDFRPSPDDAPIQIRSAARKPTNFDHRDAKTPYALLSELTLSPSLIVWKEGTYTCPVNGSGRQSIIPCDDLVIWSVPPNGTVLRQILQTARPASIHWFLVPPEEHHVQVFLQSVGKLVKDSYHEQQYYHLTDLATLTATTDVMAGLGLQFLASDGHIKIIDRTSTTYRLLPGGEPDNVERQRLLSALQQAFKEIHAFYEFLLKTDLDKLISDLA